MTENSLPNPATVVVRYPCAVCGRVFTSPFDVAVHVIACVEAHRNEVVEAAS